MNSDEVKVVLQDKEYFDYFDAVHNDEDWKTYIDKDDRKIKYKREEGCSLISIYMESVVKAPLTHVIMQIVELDFFKELMPEISKAEIHKVITNFRGIFTFQESLPWPYKTREMHVRTTGRIDTKTNCFLMAQTSLPQE